MQLQPGFLGMAHFTDPRHRVHDLTFGFLFGVTGVGMLAQLRRPSKNVAGMVMALIPWVGLLLAGVLATDVFRVIVINPSRSVAAVTVITAFLHPTGRDFFRSFSISRVNWVILTLVIIAAVPLLAFAFTNIGLQRTVPDDHAAQGHYGFMAAFGFTVIGVGLLASLRPDGWRLTAWVAGVLPALLGLTSVVYPDNSSSLSLVWAVAAIAWGVGFIAVAERTQNVGLSADDTRVEPDRGPTTRRPGWVNVLRIIALVPILLVFINTVNTMTGGGGPGLHTPPGGAGGQGDASPVAGGAVEIDVTAANFALDPDEITVTAGDDVAIVLTSVDIRHDFTIDELGVQVAAEPGETATTGFRADRPGRYTFYCSVPGHREAGMEGTLIVEGPDGDAPSGDADDTSSDDAGGHTPPFGFDHGG